MKYFLTLFFILAAFIEINAQDSLKQELVIGVKETPPFIISNSDGTFSGVSIDLWEEIAIDLGIKYRYKKLELTELLTALEVGDVDASINPLTVTSERVKSFHFTQPFYIASLGIATKQSDKNPIMTFVLNFFSADFFKAVLFLFLVLLIFGGLAWIFERKANPEEFGSGIKGIIDGIWWSAVTMTTVGYGDKSPKTLGGRIVGLVWMFTAIVIISGFTASIASSLTVNKLGTDIAGPDDLKRYKVGTIGGSTSMSYLTIKGIQFTDYDTPEQALNALSNEDVKAVVYDSPTLKYLIGQGTEYKDLTVLPHQFNTQYYGFSVAKKNTYLLDELNPVLLKHIEDVKWKAVLNQYHLLD